MRAAVQCSTPFRSAGVLAIRFSPPTDRGPTCRRSTAAAWLSSTSRRAKCSKRFRCPQARCRWGLRLSPDGERLYVANGRARTVSVIDLDDFAGRRDGARRRAPVGCRAHLRRQVSVHGQWIVERRFGHRHRVLERRHDDSRGCNAVGHRHRPAAARTLRSSRYGSSAQPCSKCSSQFCAHGRPK